MTDSTRVAPLFRLRVAMLLVALALVALAGFGLTRPTPRSDAFPEVWPATLGICSVAALETLLGVWTAFGSGPWWIRWPLGFLGEAALLLARALPVSLLAPGMYWQLVASAAASELPLFGAAVAVGATFRWLGWRSVVEADREPLWRFSLLEALVGTTLCALVFLGVRAHVQNLEALARVGATVELPLHSTAHQIVAFAAGIVVTLGSASTAVAAAAIGRPRLSAIVAAVAVAYALALGYFVVLFGGSVGQADLQGSVWYAASSAVHQGIVIGALLACRAAGWRLDREPRAEPPGEPAPSPADAESAVVS